LTEFSIANITFTHPTLTTGHAGPNLIFCNYWIMLNRCQVPVCDSTFYYFFAQSVPQHISPLNKVPTMQT
jgi:hypothetical protein